MKRKTTKTDEPSKASLAEMPEVDFSKVLPVRGRHAARAQASLDVIVIDKRLSEALGGPDRVTQILAALAEALVGNAGAKPKARPPAKAKSKRRRAA